MTQHKFGGDWTTDKLERVREYLCAYTKIFTSNPRARFFTTVYVDAFAGTGSRVDSTRSSPEEGLFNELPDLDAQSFKKGSARIALEVEPPFDQFVFVENNAARTAELERLRAEFPRRNVRVATADANEFLHMWCKTTDWRLHRAVVFLDPYGMQVDWTTVAALGRTNAVDLLYLFPLGVAVNRLLTREGPPPPAWADALTRLFGTQSWLQEFYPTRDEKLLWGVEAVGRREVDWTRMSEFFVKRLKTAFRAVAPEPLRLLNSANTPIYLLCFAASNLKGAGIALRIAKHILRP